MVYLERIVNNKRFQLVCSSIIEEKVEAIVNPANRYLSHGGGVAGLISRAGGPDIQRESTAKAPIETGEATYTTAGLLPYKYILHTVGPVWRGGTENEAELLHSAVLSVLRLANHLQLKSISMPSISTGIFGYPLEPAIKIIVSTILDYLARPSYLEEVHLCDYSHEKLQEIEDIVTALCDAKGV